MRRIIAMLLVCLTLVQMLPLGIHTHAQETETIPAETVQMPLETTLPAETEAEEEVPPAETTETEAQTTEPAAEETAAPTLAETVPGTEEPENPAYEIVLGSILEDPAEETGEPEDLSDWAARIGTPEITPQGVNDHKYYESENNNDWALADLVEHDYTVIASVGGIDTDFFAMRLSYKSKVTILAVAKKSSFGMGFYNSSEKLLAKDITGTKTNDGNYSYTMSGTYSSGKYYYVTLDSKQSSSYNYIFYVEIEPLYKTCKHTNKKKVETVEPTCGSQGYTVYSCSVCETKWKDKFVPATGAHTYYDEYDSICDVCQGNRYLGIARGACGEKMNWVIFDDGRMVVSGWGDMQLNNGNGMPWDSYKSKIKRLEVKDEVFRISDHAFENCENLTSITLAGSVGNIENGAFNNCTSLSSVSLGEGVKRIGDQSFGSCTLLRSISIPSTVTEIHAGAFAFCGRLESISVAYGNTVYSSDSQGILYNKNQTEVKWIPRGISGTVRIPATVTVMPSFSECRMVTGVVIPEGIRTIPGSCFYECDRLEYVTLPQSLTAIPQSAFYGCGSLTSITIPENVTSIGSYAFSRCTELNSLTIPGAVTSIGGYAFEYLNSLDEVTFVGNAPSFGSYPFNETAATVYYPITDSTWTSSKRQNYGGSLTWIGKCLNGHVEVIDKPGVAPTCMEPGLSPDSHCSNCGEITSVQKVLPALGHDRVTDAYVASYCETTGLTEGSHCGRCGEVFVSQTVIPALGHNRVTDAYVAPLCETTGLTEGSHCDRCQHVFVAQTVIPALGHSYTNHWCNHCGRAEFVEVTSISADKQSLAAGEQAVLMANLDYPICPETEIVWSLAEGDEAFATLEPNRDTAILTAKRLMEETTVTVLAKTADGLEPAAQITVTIQAVPADQILFAGKTLALKPINPATGKAYPSSQLTWSMEEGYEPFLKLANGKVTAQKVPEKVRTEVVATVKATNETIPYVIDIYPAVTQVELKRGEEVFNGKTLYMDYSAEPITLKVDTYPLDTLEDVTWTVSDKKGQYADYVIDGDSLTVSAPKGNAGTVTITAAVTAGVKKTATVKVSFGSFAREVTMTKPGQTTLRGGESLTLSAWISKPAVVSQPGVVWTVSDKTAVTVSSGKITAKAVAHPTTVTVTATSKDGQASASVDLRIIPKDEGKLVLMCGSDYVTGGTKAMNYGESCQLEAFSIVNGDPVPEEVTWSSAKSSIAYISQGKVTATGVGSAKITATAADGRTAVVTVKVATLVRDMRIITKDGKNVIEENGVRTVLLASGKTVNLVADILTTGASKTVLWEITEGAEYVKLANGKLTANPDMTKPAYATVKATAKDGSGVSDSIRVRILPLATGVQIYQNGNRVRSNTTYVHDMLASDVIRLSTRVYPAKANQTVVLTSSNKKTADFNEKGELVCYKPGTVTITAAAQDGSGQKVTFKLTIVKKITGLTLAQNANLAVTGGKSLKLAPMVQISPSDATNKKLTWSVAPNQYGITISSAGVLSTKKVYTPVTVNVLVTPQDGSGKWLSFDVTVYPV